MKRFTTTTKRQIVATVDYLAAQRTEDGARAIHLLLCRNRISDEELKEWRNTPGIATITESEFRERSAA